MSYTFTHLERAALAGSIRFTPAIAGFLALAVLEELAEAVRRVLPEELGIDALGGVQLNGPACDPGEALASATLTLTRLLDATRADAAVRARFDGRGARSVQELTRIIEAALIPINRSAARRELQRMYRRLDAVDWQELASNPVPQHLPSDRRRTASRAAARSLTSAAELEQLDPTSDGLVSQIPPPSPRREHTPEPSRAQQSPLISGENESLAAADWQLGDAPAGAACADLLSRAIGFQEHSTSTPQARGPSQEALRDVRRSDVDELVDNFNVQGAQSESALSLAIQRSIGIDGTPAPAVVSLEDAGAGSEDVTRSRRWPPRVAAAVVGLAAVLIWRAPTPHPGVADRAPSCRAALELRLPVGARASLRTGTAMTTGVAPVVYMNDVSCLEPVTVKILLADGEEEHHEVLSSELQAAHRARSPFILHVTR